MGLFGSGGLFGKAKGAVETVTEKVTAPKPIVLPDAAGKLPATAIHPKVAATGIVGVAGVGAALAFLLTGNLHGIFATAASIALPVGLALAAGYLKKSPPPGFGAVLGDLVTGMQEGFKKPPA